jgi:hypothetical protein
MKRGVKSLIAMGHTNAKFLITHSPSTERVKNLKLKKIQQHAIRISRLGIRHTLCCVTDKVGTYSLSKQLYSRYSDSIRAGRSGDRIPVGSEIFRIRPDRPWGPPSLLYNGYRVFHGGKAAGRGVDHPPHQAPRLKKEQSYTSTSWLRPCRIYTIFTVRRVCKKLLN